jgi:hypothetical protein
MEGGIGPISSEFRHHACFRWIAISCLVTPLVWTLQACAGFVALTLAANSAQVILLPLLAGGLWWITASARLIGPEHRTNCVSDGVVVPIWPSFATDGCSRRSACDLRPRSEVEHRCSAAARELRCARNPDLKGAFTGSRSGVSLPAVEPR